MFLNLKIGSEANLVIIFFKKTCTSFRLYMLITVTILSRKCLQQKQQQQ